MKATHYVRNVVNINSNTEKTVEKNYGSKQRNKHKEKVECPICRIEVGRNKMARHERSKRHQSNLTNTKDTKQEPEPKNIEKKKNE